MYEHIKYNHKAVKEQTLEQFKKDHAHLAAHTDLDADYKKIVGDDKPAKEPAKEK